ncbi:MAG TPA: hypothetical protein DCG48_12380 [Rhodospirillaceae bacterium]|nr:hypothetical protein [Rhodospirillaceae bacterium]|tara:strand:+ start:19166 stop:20059 length:894 start_codon:yes stop_codon:yes gene_type:complete
MQESDARTAFDALLDQLEIAHGQAIMVHSDMSGIPLPRIDAPLSRQGLQQQRDQLCQFVLDALAHRLGDTGTLIVPTFSYSTTTPGNAFHLESTPSEVGPFSEFVRVLPGARRSLHPIFSIAALGPMAKALCDNTGLSAFGQGSPWQRFSDLNVRIVTLGTSFRKSATYIHHLEQCFGSPHRFNKVLQVPVYRDGKQVAGPWLAYLRYRSVGLDIDLTRLENRLRESGDLLEAEWYGKPSSAVDTGRVDEIGYSMLHDNPWAFTDRRVIMDIQESVPDEGPCVAEQVVFELNLKATR